MNSDMSPEERLGEEIATLAARIDAATYELLVLIRKFDEEEGWNNGFLSCAHWLAWRIGLGSCAARERVRVARALGELPLMSEAMKRGQLSYSKVRALTRVARPETEESLVDLGRTSTAAQTERVVRAWRRVDRSVEAHDDQLRDAASQVALHIDENGMYVIRGRLAPEVGEVLMKALDAAGEQLYDAGRDRTRSTDRAADRPDVPGDRPGAGKLRADALGLVAEKALAGGLDSGSAGDRYQVVVHVNEAGLEGVEEAPAARSSRRRVSAETREAPEAGSSARSAAAETHHAEAPAMSNARSAPDDENPSRRRRPTPAPPPAETRTGVSAETPSRSGAWLGDSHVPVSAETARRIACDAGKVQMTHRNCEILSVGRKTRTIPPPVRRALEFRDQGCRFPGCASRHCDAHHIRHWADGGETKLSNLVLLCRRHHRLLHEGGFGVRMAADRTVRFFHPRGRPLHEVPAPPPVGPCPCDDLLGNLEDAGIFVTGDESMPMWDGTPMDLRYVLECLWKPPPHLQALVDRERCRRTRMKPKSQAA